MRNVEREITCPPLPPISQILTLKFSLSFQFLLLYGVEFHSTSYSFKIWHYACAQPDSHVISRSTFLIKWRFNFKQVSSRLIFPVWFKSDFQLFKWGHFHIFSLSYNLTSHDFWPSYTNFDLINKWRFPCCIYDPTLVEIHQSMWKVEPTVNPFSTTDNNRGESDPYTCMCLSC